MNMMDLHSCLSQTWYWRMQMSQRLYTWSTSPQVPRKIHGLIRGVTQFNSTLRSAQSSPRLARKLQELSYRVFTRDLSPMENRAALSVIFILDRLIPPSSKKK